MHYKCVHPDWCPDVVRGLDYTVLQAAYVMADVKVATRMSNLAMDIVCRLIATYFLPKDNLFPHSFKVVQGLLQTEEASAYEEHICSNP